MIVNNTYSILQTPLNISKQVIKNRIAMAPMGDIHQFFNKKTGMVNERWKEYMKERARGGTGLLMPSVFKIASDVLSYSEKGITDWMMFGIESHRDYAELAEYVHALGGKLFFQLSPGRGRVIIRDEAYEDKAFIPFSASENEPLNRPEMKCRAITKEEIEAVVEAFGEAAELLANVGIDGIELHAHEGYLLDEFATELWNKRNDRYGGSTEKRMTFATDIMREIKKRAGQDFPVVYRYGVKHFIKEIGKAAVKMGENEVGRDVEESVRIAKILEKNGFDALHVDTGCYESSYWAHPPIYLKHGFSVDLVSKVKEAVQIPVIIAGRMDNPDIAARTIKEGKADMVAIGRGLLADPYWPKKVFENRIEDITPCIGCHDLMYRSETDKYTYCTVNPFCGGESIYKIVHANKKQKVLIAGAGVAGMQAARIAALRGHDVVIYEKNNDVGGHLIAAAVPDFKEDINLLLDSYIVGLKKMGIPVHCNTAVTASLVAAESPDIVIVATGSKPVIPAIPGIANDCVATCIDVLKGKKKVGNSVVIIGGGLEGCEIALWLAQSGKKVTIIEMADHLNLNIHRSNRNMLIDLLIDANVEIITGARVNAIDGNLVMFERNEGEAITSLQTDSVVIAVGLESNAELYSDLKGIVPNLYKIGDCNEPRKIGNAIWEGTMVALNI